MSLRKRLILFFITLIGLLGLAQWWLLSALTEQLEEGRRQDALEIGKAIFEQLGMVEGFTPPPFLIADGGEIDEALMEKFAEGGVIMDGRLHGEWRVMPEDFQPPEEWLTGESSVSISVYPSQPNPALSGMQGFDLDLPFPADPIDRRLQEFRSGLILGTVLILLIALFLMSLAAHKLGVPLQELATTARKVGGGEFGRTVPVRGGAEVEEVIQSFNSMSTRLDELQQEADRLKEQAHLTEVGEMARGLAHAMRNPLHVIGLSAQRLIEEKLDDERRQELAGSVHAQVRRVDRAMRNFLALSSAGSGHLEQVSLADTCRDVALELMQSGEPVPQIKINASPDLPAMNGVAAELRALVHVLMTNAVEACQIAAGNGETKGLEESEVAVEISVAEGGDGIQIEVLDQGVGIAADLQDKLFTPHFTTKEHGAGLGLYLARRIAVSRYGGGLELANRSGGGCCARLSLKPLQEASHA